MLIFFGRMFLVFMVSVSTASQRRQKKHSCFQNFDSLLNWLLCPTDSNPKSKKLEENANATTPTNARQTHNKENFAPVSAQNLDTLGCNVILSNIRLISRKTESVQIQWLRRGLGEAGREC
jgi:hypothetical protein